MGANHFEHLLTMNSQKNTKQVLVLGWYISTMSIIREVENEGLTAITRFSMGSNHNKNTDSQTSDRIQNI